jgi:hypothetical protein
MASIFSNKVDEKCGLFRDNGVIPQFGLELEFGITPSESATPQQISQRQRLEDSVQQRIVTLEERASATSNPNEQQELRAQADIMRSFTLRDMLLWDIVEEHGAILENSFNDYYDDKDIAELVIRYVPGNEIRAHKETIQEAILTRMEDFGFEFLQIEGRDVIGHHLSFSVMHEESGRNLTVPTDDQGIEITRSASTGIQIVADAMTAFSPYRHGDSAMDQNAVGPGRLDKFRICPTRIEYRHGADFREMDLDAEMLTMLAGYEYGMTYPDIDGATITPAAGFSAPSKDDDPIHFTKRAMDTARLTPLENEDGFSISVSEAYISVGNHYLNIHAALYGDLMDPDNTVIKMAGQIKEDLDKIKIVREGEGYRMDFSDCPAEFAERMADIDVTQVFPTVSADASWVEHGAKKQVDNLFSFENSRAMKETLGEQFVLDAFYYGLQEHVVQMAVNALDNPTPANMRISSEHAKQAVSKFPEEFRTDVANFLIDEINSQVHADGPSQKALDSIISALESQIPEIVK